MLNISINYIAVLASAIVYMILGFLWYGPFFGKPWMKLVGMTRDHIDEMKKKGGMGKTYAISFLQALLKAYVLAYFIDIAGARTVSDGAQIGFYMWLGFVATSGLNQYLYAVKKKPWTLYLIDQGYLLVSLVLAGAILAVWV